MSAIDPRHVEAIVHRIPAGKVLTLGALRDALAHGRAAAEAPTDAAVADAIAALVAARPTVDGRAAPTWRVVRDDGALLDAPAAAVAAQARTLAAEDVTVLHVGKVPRVTEVSHFAWTPPRLGKSPRVLSGASAAPRPRRRPR